MLEDDHQPNTISAHHFAGSATFCIQPDLT